MDTQDYLTAINAPGVNTLGVAWTTTVKPAAAWRSHTLTKRSTAIVMTGVEYRNLAVNSDTETGALPWGEWSEYPYIVTHNGGDYARLYTVDNTVRTLYYVDGIDVSRDEFNAYLTPSQAAPKRPNGGTITVKMENVRLVGAPALV
jgi:hypothetical protein